MGPTFFALTPLPLVCTGFFSAMARRMANRQSWAPSPDGVIAELGILIASLDMVAPILSM